jgi:redox-sensitive bicupin YhaK (pirin superfamily)
VHIRQMIGGAFGLHSPVHSHAQTLYSEVRMEAGTKLDLPNHVEEIGIYVLKGTLQCGEETVAERQMLILDGATDATLRCTTASHFVLIGGAHMGQRFIEWNFVSSSKAAIEKAKADWKAGNFPTIEGDAEEYIPLPQ